MFDSYIPVRKHNRPNIYEALLLGFVFILLVTGVILSRTNLSYFENEYTREDGFVENFTIFPLSIAFVVAISYLVKVAKYRSRMFIICMLIAAAFSLFVGGEEISWGQRIFHIQSSEFFKANNAQQETNLHNMVVGGTKINKLVFSLLLTIVVAIYLLVMPILYNKSGKVRRFIDWAGIPVPHRNHIIAALVLFGTIGIIPSSKNAELLEMGITSIFLLILTFPQNVHVFRVQAPLNQIVCNDKWAA